MDSTLTILAVYYYAVGSGNRIVGRVVAEGLTGLGRFATVSHELAGAVRVVFHTFSLLLIPLQVLYMVGKKPGIYWFSVQPDR